MSTDNLKIYRKAENLTYKIYPSLRNFPKSEKFSLCQEIKLHLFHLMSRISLANTVKSKRKTYLQEVDGYLENLRVILRLSRQQRYISKSFYEDLDLSMSEIKAMLVGWLKAT